MTVTIVSELDLQDPTVVADVLAPVIGERVGAILGNAAKAIECLQEASNLLRTGDGVKISVSMAAVINAYTSWLRGQIEDNAAGTKRNRERHQRAFMNDTPIAWMVRKDVGAKRGLSQVRLKRGPGLKMSDMLNQFAPGAVYELERVGYNVIRRSFRQTDSPNIFDVGQPEIMRAMIELSDAERQPLVCMSDGAAAINGQGCCYYPGEAIQFSFGTYPYIHGRSIVSATPVDPEVPLIRHAALMTPSAHHVLVDEQEVYAVYQHFLKMTRMLEIPRIGKGQKDPGIYLDEQNLPRTIGDGQYWELRYENGTKDLITGDAIRDVAAAFYQFFVVRQMVLRQFGWLAPSVKKAAESSRDPRIRKLARGEKVELWKWDPYDPLVQLARAPEGAPPKRAPAPQDPPPRPTPTPSGASKRYEPVPKTTETPTNARGRWLPFGLLALGVGGAAYLGRHRIGTWARRRKKRALPMDPLRK